jgi:hypothetical protein
MISVRVDISGMRAVGDNADIGRRRAWQFEMVFIKIHIILIPGSRHVG